MRTWICGVIHHQVGRRPPILPLEELSVLEVRSSVSRCGRHLAVRVLRLNRRPSAPSKFTRKLLGRQHLQELLLRRLPPRRGCDQWSSIGLCILQLLDESCSFVTRELAPGLTLGEPHWSSCIPKIGVPGNLEKFQEFSHLGLGSRWT